MLSDAAASESILYLQDNHSTILRGLSRSFSGDFEGHNEGVTFYKIVKISIGFQIREQQKEHSPMLSSFTTIFQPQRKLRMK